MHVQHSRPLFVARILNRRVPDISSVVDDDVDAAERRKSVGDDATPANFGSVTSPLTARAWTPIDASAPRVPSAGTWSKSLITTLAPSVPSFSAMARPTPRPDPVTMAVFRSNLSIAIS